MAIIWKFYFDYPKYIWNCILNYWKPRKENRKGTGSFLESCSEIYYEMRLIYTRTESSFPTLPFFYENYSNLYFIAKHLKTGLKRVWWNLQHSLFQRKCPLRAIWEPALIFYVRPWQRQIKSRNWLNITWCNLQLWYVSCYYYLLLE